MVDLPARLAPTTTTRSRSLVALSKELTFDVGGGTKGAQQLATSARWRVRAQPCRRHAELGDARLLRRPAGSMERVAVHTHAFDPFAVRCVSRPSEPNYGPESGCACSEKAEPRADSLLATC